MLECFWRAYFAALCCTLLHFAALSLAPLPQPPAKAAASCAHKWFGGVECVGVGFCVIGGGESGVLRLLRRFSRVALAGWAEVLCVCFELEI